MEDAQTQAEQCPYAKFRELRSHAPVSEIAPGMFAVTRYEDVKQVLRDYGTWSARAGENNSFAVFGPSAVQPQIDQIMRDYPETPVLMRTDPPEHTRVRSLVSRVLTPQEVARMDPRIRQIIRDLIAEWIDRGQVEFVSAFAVALPSAVTNALLGCPPQMREQLRFWADEIMSRFAGPQAPERQLEVARNIAQMGRYFMEQIAQRRAQPRDDLISLLAHAQIDGDRLDDCTIVNVIETFLVGGNETTTFLLGGALLRLAKEPSLADCLRREPARIPAFVEEVLRLEAPAQSVVRMATRDVELGGCPIPRGSLVLAFLASANRDEAVYANADQLDLDRPTTLASRHLAFGYANHACLGLLLARAEARIALETLLPRMHNIALADPAEVRWVGNYFLRGPSKLDLTFAPQAAGSATT